MTAAEAETDPVHTLSTVPAGARTQLIAGAQRTILARDAGVCLLQWLGSEDGSVVWVDGWQTQSARWRMHARAPRVTMVFARQQDWRLDTGGAGAVTIEEGFVYLLAFPAVGGSELEIPKGHTHWMQLMMTRQSLETKAAPNTAVQALLARLPNGDPQPRLAIRVRLSPGILRQLEAINTYAGPLQHWPAFLQARSIDLLREYGEEQERQAAHPPLDVYERILVAKKYLDDPLGPRRSVADCCRLAGLSRADLQRGFKTMVGTTVDKYQAGIRLDHAAQLLVTDDRLSVYEIGRRIGYAEESSFIKAFNRRFHRSPLRYRKQYRG